MKFLTHNLSMHFKKVSKFSHICVIWMTVRLFMEWGKIWITFGTFYDQLRALTLRGHKTFQLLLTSMLEWREVKNLAHNFWLCFCLLRYWTIFHFYFLWNWYWKLKSLHSIKTVHFFKKSQAQFCSAITSSNIHPF